MEMLKELIQITKSEIKALDIFYVLKELRKCARILVKEGDHKLLDFLKDNEIAFCFSRFKIIKKLDSSRSYADLGIRVKKSNKIPGDLLLYISTDKEIALTARDYEDENDHRNLGKLLGYPECCVDFFVDNLESAENLLHDYTPLCFANSNGVDFSFLLNNCLRGYDTSLISHFPCNFQCEKSVIKGQHNLDCLRKEDELYANKIVKKLSRPVIYSPGLGVYYFDSVLNEGVMEYSQLTLGYQRENKFTKLLKSKNRIRVIDMNNFLIGGIRVSDKDTYFGNFS